MQATRPHEEESLEQLMQRVAADDPAAFEQLYERAAPRLMAKLSSSGRDREQLRDVVQTTFMKIYRARGSYQPGAPVLPWMTVVAKRTLIDEWRPMSARMEVLSSDGQLPDAGGATAADLDELLQLQRALRDLPEQYRDAIELTKFNGLSGKEAARHLKTTTAALKQRVHRGIGLLRSLLDPVVEEPAAV
jgi:RNA polymerase sigma-70 factor (ECF subfamily)